MRLTICVCIYLVLSTLDSVHGLPFNIPFLGPYKPQTGFRPEEIILNTPNSAAAKDTFSYYTSGVALAGLNRSQAEWTYNKFKEYGLEAKIESYYPYLNYPKERRLAIVEPEDLRYEATLREAIVVEDPTSIMQDAVPTFHGLSARGDVTAELVYTNYGRWEDHEWLKEKGVNLTGKICIARYGHVFRSIKLRNCQVNGGIGTIIYSDPADDGPVGKEGDAYPEGPWRNKNSVQRGSVHYSMLGLGDPLTPGYPATKNAKRLSPEESPYLTKIPSLPISWADAEPLLRSLEGYGVKVDLKEWKGGLDISYWTGPSAAKVNLKNVVEGKVTEIWNVIARIPGTEEPDRVIIIGNHRDTWGFGGADPHSGSAPLLETARSFGKLLEMGWRPKRTIVFASWDAEEYGIIGSTEWVEDHQDFLRKNAIAYINMDVAVTGPNFAPSSVPTLHDLIRRTVAKITDPRTGNTVLDAWRERDGNMTIKSLGAGSDFGPFLDYIGIGSMDMRFSGKYGVYHSNYDSYHWMEKFGDPNFDYMPTLAKIIGLMTLELADLDILPFNVSRYPPAMLSYTDNLDKLVAKYSADPRDKPVEFTELRHAIHVFAQATKPLAKEIDDLREKKDRKSDGWAERVRRVNERLIQVERGFIDPRGLPKRPLFKHQLYATGIRYGYDVQYFPAIADHIEEKEWEQAKVAQRRIADLLRSSAELLARP
ncbi:uncharacterized protein VTP21DRAFT_4834 [Calcarisporiella thermophila]|uniref:uncharacterized protein n=1 Tax=Calcarisporiella thermophila TaxID=911321 RepID=UPI0037447F18